VRALVPATKTCPRRAPYTSGPVILVVNKRDAHKTSMPLASVKDLSDSQRSLTVLAQPAVNPFVTCQSEQVVVAFIKSYKPFRLHASHTARFMTCLNNNNTFLNKAFIFFFINIIKYQMKLHNNPRKSLSLVDHFLLTLTKNKSSRLMQNLGQLSHGQIFCFIKWGERARSRPVGYVSIINSISLTSLALNRREKDIVS